ncbi:hypothetical protein ACGFX4_28620 [Kitasatospora sp. NPDC048365]|uniref:hypothetical protein n=1 Tax=Kitasatospora sp. NPDC048365 TaxID=3364050 RepID=UPI0037139CD7
MDLNTYAQHFDGRPEVSFRTDEQLTTAAVWLAHLHGYAFRTVSADHVGHKLTFVRDTRPEAGRRLAWLRDPVSDPDCPAPVARVQAPYGWTPPGWPPHSAITVPPELLPGLASLVRHEQIRNNPVATWIALLLPLLAVPLCWPYDTTRAVAIQLGAVASVGVIFGLRSLSAAASRKKALAARRIWAADPA